MFEGLFSLFSGKSAEREMFDRFTKVGKPALTRQLVFMRMVKEQVAPFDSLEFGLEDAVKLTEAGVSQIRRTLDGMTDSELLGTPEATMIVTLEHYWRIKFQTNGTDFEVFKKIEKLRYFLEAPQNLASPEIDLATFITRIIRNENPACSPENISDETIRALVGIASTEVKEISAVVFGKSR